MEEAKQWKNERRLRRKIQMSERISANKNDHGSMSKDEGTLATGFRDDSEEQEVEELLTRAITTIGMPTKHIQIKSPAKRITHAFLQLSDSEERNKYIRSANTLKSELKRKKNKNVADHGC